METKEMITNTVALIPEIEGPIPVTEDSHPLCAMLYSMTPTDPANWGYEEIEYFLSGRANIYGTDKNDFPVVKKTDLPYKNRILIRRPVDKKKFSGRVYLDIMNATQGYDIEDLWHRNWNWCMKNGHGYIGITSKPVNVLSLKTFDYDRYKTLNWSNGETVPQPATLRYASIPGTEEGLFWDMLGQLAALLRCEHMVDYFFGSPVRFLYLTGQSQSGAYLNTYIHYFDSFLTDKNGKKTFDGYLNIVGAVLRRKICQDELIEPLRFYVGDIRPTDTPFISINSEGDVRLFELYFQANILTISPENSDTDKNKRRHYDIAAAPHTDVYCTLLSSTEEVEKTDRTIHIYEKNKPADLNDIPTEYYIVGLLEKLHVWASKGIAPDISAPIQHRNGQILRDEHGNVRGGLRSPFVEVPAATYVASNPDDPEGISGTMTYFTREKFNTLYSSFENYLERFTAYTKKQAAEGWITGEDSEKVIAWAHQVKNKLR
jgi:hypothetical protein